MIWQAFCKQAGVIPVHSMQETVFTLAALKRMPLPAGVNVAVLGGAGGGSVTMTDLAEKEGLRVPHFAEQTIGSLEAFVPLAGNSVRNPIDAFFTREDHFTRLMELLSADPNIDALIYSLHIHWMYRDLGRIGLNKYIQMVTRGSKKLGKPMLVVLTREGDVELDMVMMEME
jgi:acyl-CoA synthetase (NDP forming)